MHPTTNPWEKPATATRHLHDRLTAAFLAFAHQVSGPLSREREQQTIRARLDAGIRHALHDICDELERDPRPDPFGLREAAARGLRPDPVVPERRDA